MYPEPQAYCIYYSIGILEQKISFPRQLLYNYHPIVVLSKRQFHNSL